MIVSGIALAGGGARMPWGSCGAYSAGLMALSAALCPDGDELSASGKKALDDVRPNFYEFRDWFAGEFGGAISPAGYPHHDAITIGYHLIVVQRLSHGPIHGLVCITS